MSLKVVTVKPDEDSVDLGKVARENDDCLITSDASGEPYPLTVVAGFDTEYERIPGTRKNTLISVQIAAVCPEGTCRFIMLSIGGQRPTWRRLAKAIVRELNLPPDVDTSRIHLILVAHNALAEWSHMADRDDPEVLKRLDHLRKTVVTARPFKCRINTDSMAYVSLVDTMPLAPESRKSLEKLADVLGSDAPRKIKIPRRYIKAMSQLLRDDPELFIRYAMRDAELCLLLFFLLQRNANMLVFGELRQFFRTLAAPTVKMFLQQTPWAKEYLKQLRHPRFSAGMEMVKNAYNGGLNDSYYVGFTNREFAPGRIKFVDFDFPNCYPTILTLICKLDETLTPDLIRPRYWLDDEARTALLAENVSDEVLDKVHDALSKSQFEFERLLEKDTRCRRMAKVLRYHCSVHQPRHLYSWRQLWLMSRELPCESREHFLIPGFADVRFRFPEEVAHPTLFHVHPDYGLVFVREGEGVFTAVELMNALDAGAEITVISSVEFYIERDEEEYPIFMYRDFVRDLIIKRREYESLETPGGTAMAEILKTFANSVYGKLAQGINERLLFRPSTRSMMPIDRSAITEPVTAALITGAVRAALCAIFQAIDECNRERPADRQLVLISATTDGFLLGVPNETGETAEAHYDRTADDLKLIKDERLKPTPFLKNHGCGDLIDRMGSKIPVMLLQAARQHLTGDPEMLVIKNVVDEVISIKTRGQVGLLQSGDAPLLAMCGHKVPEADLVDENGDLPRGIASNNRKAAWVQKHLALREESFGEDTEV